jgi:hypothetical protein
MARVVRGLIEASVIVAAFVPLLLAVRWLGAGQPAQLDLRQLAWPQQVLVGALLLPPVFVLRRMRRLPAPEAEPTFFD